MSEWNSVIHRNVLPRCIPPRGSLPQTIEDAILVVRQLGEQYLWVDAYCINQSDPVEKQATIQRMGTIYEDSYLTICDLSSKKSRTGLPGISCPLMQFKQSSIRTDKGLFLLNNGDWLKAEIEDAAWSSRAWALQEAALSRKRLCFASNRVFFWCKQELFQQTVNLNLSKMRRFEVVDTSPYTSCPFEIEFERKQLELSAYARLVASYTSRAVSFASDALNAVQSLLDRIVLSNGISFLSALPDSNIVSSLLWTPVEGNAPLLRRIEFPSWSWLGWQGPIQYALAPHLPLSSKPIYTSNVPCEFRGTSFHRQDQKKRFWFIVLKTASQSLHMSRALSGHERLTVHSESAWFGLRLSFKAGELYPDPELGSWNGDREDDQVPCPGDLWEVLNHNGQLIRKGHHSIHRYEHPSVCLYCDREVSARLSMAGTQWFEFLLIQHWIQQGEYETNGDTIGTHYFGEQVWAMVLLPNPDQTVERIGLVLMEPDDWQAAHPQPTTVTLV